MAENTVYTVSDFIKEYSSAATDAARSKICQKHMTRTYVPVLEKYVALSMGFNKSCRQDNGLIHLNSFMSYIMYTIISLSLYYDFVVVDDNRNYMDVYDSLVNSGIRDTLLVTIGENELNELAAINNFIVSDAKENEMLPQSFIAGQVSRVLNAVKDKLTPEMITNIKAAIEEIKK